MKLVGTNIFFKKTGLWFWNKENSVQKDVSCLFYIEESSSLAAFSWVLNVEGKKQEKVWQVCDMEMVIHKLSVW